mmetsp:Transcript_27698/g.74530  ORF Transcript_27698/g.74530 Transcript_27698/m.74530 type:complete len:367 (+) Transcript_27698:150-1250(+)
MAELEASFKEEAPRAESAAALSDQIVNEAFSAALESTTTKRQRASKALAKLADLKLVSTESLEKATGEQIEFAEDVAIDVPAISQYLAQLIAGPVTSGALPIRFIAAKAAEFNLVESRTVPAFNLIAHLAAEMKEASGAGPARDFFAKAQETGDLDLLKLAHEEVRSAGLAPLLARHKLSWLDPSSAVEAAAEAALKDGVEPEAAAQVLAPAAADSSAVDVGEAVMRQALAWWEAAVGGPDKLKAAEADDAIKAAIKTLVPKKPVLVKLLGGETKADHRRQLGALRAVHAFCHKLEYPHTLIVKLFTYFYDVDIVTEDSLNMWREDTAELPGKTTALVKLNQFYTWLDTADDEDEEGEEEDGEDED